MYQNSVLTAVHLTFLLNKQLFNSTSDMATKSKMLFIFIYLKGIANNRNKERERTEA